MNTKNYLVLIEDEKNICNFMATTLTAHGYKVSTAPTAKAGISLITSGCPDLILLDLGLPDMDGIEVIREIRTWASIPIIVISARRHSNRLQTDSLLNQRPYQAGELTVDFEKRLVTLGGSEIHLTQIEYKIVSLLAKNSGKVITYDTIISNVWGPYADDNNRILRVNMANIRRKIEKNPAEPDYIFTEIGIGYRMLEDKEN